MEIDSCCWWWNGHQWLSQVSLFFFRILLPCLSVYTCIGSSIVCLMIVTTPVTKRIMTLYFNYISNFTLRYIGVDKWISQNLTPCFSYTICFPILHSIVLKIMILHSCTFIKWLPGINYDKYKVIFQPSVLLLTLFIIIKIKCVNM